MAIQTTNPATGEVLKTYEALSDDEIEVRLTRAVDAFAICRATTFAERAGWLRAAADILDAEKDDIAVTMTTEMGKTRKAAAGEAAKCATSCANCLRLGRVGFLRFGRRLACFAVIAGPFVR